MFSSYNTAYKQAPYNIANINYSMNNQYRGFPPKMSDSRSITTSYQPISVTDYYLKNSVSKSNWGYREYLMKNAEEIQKEELRKSLNDNGYYQRFINSVNEYPDVATPIMPYFYNSLFDTTRPFGYKESDLKDIYLSRERLNSRLMIPQINVSQNENV
jgi:hypothetical protein